MSAALSDLLPAVETKANAFLAAVARTGILLRVTQTLRTYEQQAALYAQGRTMPGPIVTHAPAGYSLHNFGRAFDICQIGTDPYPADPNFWQNLGDAGEAAGLEWGGRWKFADRPHFQDSGGLILAQMRALHDAVANAG